MSTERFYKKKCKDNSWTNFHCCFPLQFAHDWLILQLLTCTFLKQHRAFHHTKKVIFNNVGLKGNNLSWGNNGI